MLTNAHDASQLVGSVLSRSKPFDQYSLSFLSDFLLPAFALALPLPANAPLTDFDLPPKTLRDLHNQVRSSTVKRTTVRLSFNRSDAVCYLNKEPNVLEKLCFAACGVDVGIVDFIEGPEEHPAENAVLRRELVGRAVDLLSDGRDADFAALLRVVPLSMLEGLADGTVEEPPTLSRCKVVSLEPRVTLDEDYAFFIAKARMAGLIILGEPHGAYYFQASQPTAFEVTERGLSDVYSAPSWSTSSETINGIGSLPNARASKNKFIYLRNFLSSPRLRKSRDRSAIIILPLFSSYRFYCDPVVTLDQWTDQLGKLISLLEQKNIRDVYLKPHPREPESVVTHLNSFCEDEGLLYEAENIRQSGIHYRDVVFFSPLSTGIIEIAVQRESFSIFFSGSATVRSDYEQFLFEGALSSELVTAEDGSGDRLLRFTSKTFLRAYNATWLYALSWARGFKKAATVR